MAQQPPQQPQQPPPPFQLGTETSRAYIIPAAAFCFFGVYECGAALLIIASSVRSAKLTLLTFISIFTALAALALASCDAAFLDYRVRTANFGPVLTPTMTMLFYFIYGLVPVVEAGLCYICVTLVGTIFNPNDVFYRSVRALAVLVIAADSTHAILGIYFNYSHTVGTSMYLSAMVWISLIASIFESALSISCCVGFLQRLSKGLRVKFYVLIYDLITKHNGQRLLVVILLRALKTVVVLIGLASSPGIVSVSFNYLHAWLFPLELAGLMTFAFEAAKQMLTDYSLHNTHNNSSTSNTTGQHTPATAAHPAPEMMLAPEARRPSFVSDRRPSFVSSDGRRPSMMSMLP
ncbi:hypothetical protein BC831DRAFT_513955 [Entophlyctis helioformis]|nr:hypothetical protein BC831DRAFT_513955 [Entophlyctis helioformis]